MVIVNTAVYVQGHLGKSDVHTALAMLALGAGSICAAIFIPRLLANLRERSLMLGGGGLLALAMVPGYMAPDYETLLALWFAMGAGLSLAQTPSGRLVTDSCKPGDRTALFAANFSLSHGCWFFGYLLAWHLSSTLGVPKTFLILGLLIIAALITASRLWPRQEPETLEHHHEDVEHEHVHSHDDMHHEHLHAPKDATADPAQPHTHRHHHPTLKHSHPFVIDMHHTSWPNHS